MNTHEKSSIGETVANDYRTAAVFKKHKIDFCCQGNRTIEEACAKSNIDANVLLDELNAVAASNVKSDNDFQTWQMDLLVDYIVKKHHRYVEEKILEITPYLDKICRVHGQRHPELFEIKEQFDAVAEELTVHMKKEELILFPFINKMVKEKQMKQNYTAANFGSVQNPIQMMMDEHTVEGDRFKIIEKISNSYTPPADACNTYSVTFALLKEFEQDLHLHIHLENNILFPKAIALEKEMNVVNQ